MFPSLGPTFRILFSVLVVALFAGCTSSVQDYADAKQTVDSMRQETRDGCEFISYTHSDRHMATAICDSTVGGKTLSVEVSRCDRDESKDPAGVTVAGEAERGTMHVVVLAGATTLHDETVSAAHGMIYFGDYLGHHASYTVRFTPSAELKDFSVQLQCAAA